MAKGQTVIKWYGDDLLQAVREDLDDALFDETAEFENDAVARAPKLTGRLRESVWRATRRRSTYVKRKGDKRKKAPKQAGVVAVGFAAPHSHLVEFGTARMAAQPFLRPTLDSRGKSVGVAVTKHVARALEKNRKLKR